MIYHTASTSHAIDEHLKFFVRIDGVMQAAISATVSQEVLPMMFDDDQIALRDVARRSAALHERSSGPITRSANRNRASTGRCLRKWARLV